ncbi:MAG: caspase family protein [Aquabacterium sp.]|nr:MAG: caspase family protein [Aquabacterium sp.]
MAKKALCIGINDYPGTGSDLAGCINDAHDWAAELGARGYEVAKLLDKQATRAAMIESIGTLVSTATEGDSIVITYSGHGTWVPDTSGDEPDGRDEALCPWDLTTKGPLLDDDLGQLFLHRRPGVRVLLLSDSCHSGSVTRGDDSDADPKAPLARFLPPAVWMKPNQLPPAITRQPATVLSGLRRTGGDLLLAGCQDTEYSWDANFNNRPNGAFTYYALKTLKTLPANATYSQWFKALRNYLPSSRYPQAPQLFGGASARRFKIFA